MLFSCVNPPLPIDPFVWKMLFFILIMPELKLQMHCSICPPLVLTVVLFSNLRLEMVAVNDPPVCRHAKSTVL